VELLDAIETHEVVGSEVEADNEAYSWWDVVDDLD
jgi:hypothetical protein